MGAGGVVLIPPCLDIRRAATFTLPDRFGPPGNRRTVRPLRGSVNHRPTRAKVRLPSFGPRDPAGDARRR
jgi:hypothetical protein